MTFWPFFREAASLPLYSWLREQLAASLGAVAARLGAWAARLPAPDLKCGAASRRDVNACATMLR